MAGENDVFTVLGTVKVDLNTLKASLSAAEAEVQKSAQRQKASFDQMSKQATDSVFKKPDQGGDKSKSTWWSDPNMAGFGEGAGKAAKKHLSDVEEGFKKVSHHSGMSISNIRGFSHIINQAIPGLGGMSSGLISVARHMGVWGAAALVAAGALAVFISRVEEAAKVNYEIKRSLATEDFERLDKALGEANEEQAKQLDLLERSNQKWTSFSAVIDSYSAGARIMWADASGAGPTAATDKVNKLKAAWDKANATLNVSGTTMRQLRDVEQQLLTFNEQQVRYGIQRSDTAKTLGLWFNVLNEVQKENSDITKKNITDDFNAFAAKKGLVKGTKEYADAYKVVTEKLLLEDDKLRDSQYHNAEEQKKRLAELKTAEVETANVIAGEYGKREQATLDLRKVEVEAARELAQLRGDMMKQTVDASGAITAATDIEIQKIRQAEAVADSASKSIVENLQAQVAAGIEVVANQRKIVEEEAARATGRVEAQLKVKTIGVQRDKDLAAEAKRVYDAEISRITSTTEAYYGMRKALGESTINDEIKSQQALNNLYVKGTAEYYNGLAKVAQLQKQMREEAKSTFQQIAGAAAESLKKRTGRKAFTLGELQTEAGAIEKQGQALFGEAGRGRAVDTDALMRAMGMQGGFEQFAAQGGSLRERFETAITKPGGFAEAGTSTFKTGAPEQDMSMLMKASADLFKAGVSDFQDAVKAFAAAQTSSGSPDLQQATLSSTIGRMGQLESKRGPAPQTGLS